MICKICGEARLAALKQEDNTTVCYSCSESYNHNRHKQGMCFLCGRCGYTESHHVFTKKVHPVTVPLCINCHRCIESGSEYGNNYKKILALIVAHIMRTSEYGTDINHIEWRKEIE